MTRLQQLEQQLTEAIARRDSTNTEHSSDPALARLAHGALKQHRHRNDAQMRRWRDAQARVDRLQAEVKAEQRRERRQEEADRPRLTRADVEAATHVHDGYRWHKVVRVNAKTVTVATEYSWTDRIPFAKIRSVAKPAAETSPGGSA